MPGSTELWFATSNGHKFDEARVALEPYGVVLRRLPSKGTEVQSDDLAAIASRAAAEVHAEAGRPVIAEDAGLFVDALGGFPGPYSAYAYRTLGCRGLLKLMAGEESREAEFVSAVALAAGGGRTRTFTGRLSGAILAEARGARGFGFDPIFVPRGGKRTLAELTLRQKAALSHRSRALAALGAWLGSHPLG